MSIINIADVYCDFGVAIGFIGVDGNTPEHDIELDARGFGLVARVSFSVETPGERRDFVSYFGLIDALKKSALVLQYNAMNGEVDAAEIASFARQLGHAAEIAKECVGGLSDFNDANRIQESLLPEGSDSDHIGARRENIARHKLNALIS